MAKKKKTNDMPEEKTPVDMPEEKFPVDEQKELENACFIPFENGMMESVTISGEDLNNAVTVTVSTDTADTAMAQLDKKHEDYIKDIAHAFDMIEKCNLYIWAGMDWGAGRIYEMSRKEWANYILAMYDWSDMGFRGNAPEVPPEVKDI